MGTPSKCKLFELVYLGVSYKDYLNTLKDN